MSILPLKSKELLESWTELFFFCVVSDVFNPKLSQLINKWSDIKFPESFLLINWTEWAPIHGTPLKVSGKNLDLPVLPFKFPSGLMIEWEVLSISFTEKLTILMDKMVKISEKNQFQKNRKNWWKKRENNWSVNYQISIKNLKKCSCKKKSQKLHCWNKKLDN